MVIQLIVRQGVTHNRIFLRKCARWSMQGNFHEPFLGGWAGAIPPGYPAGGSDITSLPDPVLIGGEHSCGQAPCAVDPV